MKAVQCEDARSGVDAPRGGMYTLERKGMKEGDAIANVGGES